MYQYWLFIRFGHTFNYVIRSKSACHPLFFQMFLPTFEKCLFFHLKLTNVLEYVQNAQDLGEKRGRYIKFMKTERKYLFP